MAAPQRIAPVDAELVTFAQARKILGGISYPKLLELIAEGHLNPHPVLADRLVKDDVKRFARADTESRAGREVATPATEISLQGPWGVPKMR